MLYKFSGIYTHKGWVIPGFIEADEKGIITRVSKEQFSKEPFENINGYAIPGFRNSHSHAFQYAMAGIAERHKSGTRDDFWSWRETMYKVALTMSPDQMEKIAAFLYSEMLRHGYTHVAEFHYVHHDQKGNAYGNLAEMGERLLSAAAEAGIKITLIPIFYQTGNFGQPPTERQRRFICNSYDDYINLLESSREIVERFPLASLGSGIHSLRAVKSEDVIRMFKNKDFIKPFHIHVSEQLKEVDDCIGFYGRRPVQWLLENIELDKDYNLVHATHLDDTEVSGLAKSEANVVLCPSTEGNLGDGIFRLSDFKNEGGKWSIGTDSHIGLNPLEELRLLDYRERLVSHQRNILNDENFGDCGEFGFQKVHKSGKLAMGDNSEGFLDVENPLDAVVFRDDHPLIASGSADILLSTIIYSLDSSQVLGTMINGKWAVKENHINGEKLRSDFVQVVKELGIRV